jgi:phospholipase A1/A2
MTSRPTRAAKPIATAALACLALLAGVAHGQANPVTNASANAWQQCVALGNDRDARLACFDRWARAQQPAAAVPPALASNQPVAPTATTTATPPATAPTGPVDAAVPATRIIEVASTEGCKDPQYSELSRFWELESGTDCGSLGLRGYKPVSLSVISADSVNTQPSSPSAGHTAAAPVAYRRTENRIQLSVRTKIAQGLLTQNHPTLKDSLWFGYTQQSYWQLFTPQLSRPFRSTDHEPEIIYVYPTDAQLPGGWRLRYSGIAAVHQSNGQSLPLSRSWNRVVLMAGMEHGNRFRVQGRIWQRLHESSGSDDNPDISNYIGRAEVSGFWNLNRDNTIGMTLRHSLRETARGSVRLEWLQAVGKGGGTASGLQFHTQLFSGYGDSLLDYNRKRNVLSIGLSLMDF